MNPDPSEVLTNFEDIKNLEAKVIEGLRSEDIKGQEMVGLAFSGGGIRSATLNLGILQGFAKQRILQRFDYLSTVSGGGYIGAWFSRLVKAHGLSAVQTGLAESTQAHPRTTVIMMAIEWLRSYSNYLTPKAGLFTTDTLAAIAQWLTNTLLNQLLLMMLLTAVMLGVWLLSHSTPDAQTWALSTVDPTQLPTQLLHHIQHSMLAASGVLLTLISVGASLFLSLRQHQRQADAYFPILGFATGVVGLILFLWSYPPVNAITLTAPHCLWETQSHTHSPNLLIGVGVPLASLLMSLFLILAMGLLGRKVQPHTREWWHRVGGINMGFIVIWLVLFAFAVYIPSAVHPYIKDGMASGFASAITWLVAFLTSRLGKNKQSSAGEGAPNAQKLAKFLPYVVIALTLLVAGYLGYLLAQVAHPYWTLIGLSLLTVFISLRFDINVFSLHNFYRNRLTRCYLGATNPKRKGHPFTGFDESDDIKLAEMTTQRPLHIVNTALNISDGSELAWQQRQATAFMFNPLYCGFVLPCKQSWYPTALYTGDGGPKLGSLIATSGAAASPNMGYHTNPMMGMIMTIFNARLGRWFGNPLHENLGNRLLGCLGLSKIFVNPAERQSPFWNLFYLIKELITSTGTTSGYLYLSDGGHFENLGIYELVRRRCKLIIAIDAGEDGQYQFEDLGNAIRKCKVDFGVTINIAIDGLLPMQDCKYGSFKCGSSHFAVGTIDYMGDGKAEQLGHLVYIKSSLTGDEPTDLINFKLQEPAFPHHSTIDQFFNESQFESYRRLGEHIADQTLSKLQNMTEIKKLLWPEKGSTP